MDVESENNFNKLKRRIVDAYRNYHPVQHNVSREERRAIRTLKEREVTVKCSDKSKSLVVMNKATYEEKANQILGDTQSYERVETTAETLEEKVKTQLKSMKSLKENLPAGVYNSLFPK